MCEDIEKVLVLKLHFFIFLENEDCVWMKKTLMGRIKAFDKIDHELLLAKLHAHNFGKQALHIIYSYLSNRKQRKNTNNVVSSWKDLVQGVPQVSVFGPLFFRLQRFVVGICILQFLILQMIRHSFVVTVFKRS